MGQVIVPLDDDLIPSFLSRLDLIPPPECLDLSFDIDLFDFFLFGEYVFLKLEGMVGIVDELVDQKQVDAQN